jgi:hypothetical protein
LGAYQAPMHLDAKPKKIPARWGNQAPLPPRLAQVPQFAKRPKKVFSVDGCEAQGGFSEGVVVMGL